MWTEVMELIIACCGNSGQWTLQPQDNGFWSELLLNARQQGVSPLLHKRLPALVSGRSIIPAAIREEFSRDYYTVAARNTVFLEALTHILQIFRRAHLPIMVLKGMVLAEMVYENPALRSMADVDLLVHPQDLPQIAEMLTTLGYTSPDLSCVDLRDPSQGFLTTAVFLPPSGPSVPFHLHWHWINSSIPNQRMLTRVSMNPVWHEAVEIGLAGTRALVMAPHHFLIHLCEHSLRVTHSLAKLRYLCDLHETILHYGNRLNWEKLVKAAQDFGLASFTRIPLMNASHLLGTPVPPEALAALRTEHSSFGEKLFERLSRHGLAPPGSSYLVHLSENQGFFNKAHFVFQTIFPPRQVMAQRSGLAITKIGGSHYLRRLMDAVHGLAGFVVHDGPPSRERR